MDTFFSVLLDAEILGAKLRALTGFI